MEADLPPQCGVYIAPYLRNGARVRVGDAGVRMALRCAPDGERAAMAIAFFPRLP